MREVIGNFVVDLVIRLSNLLREEHTPGLVSALLLLALVGAVVYFGIKTWRRRRALKALQDVVADAVADPADFGKHRTEVTRRVRELASGRAYSPWSPWRAVVTAWDESWRAVVTAWGEYSETFVHPKKAIRTSCATP